MEQWKLIHTVKSYGKTHIKGDKYYISNKGRVKLNDIILDFGKGLLVNKDMNIIIYGCPLPEKTFHRTIYSLFTDEYIHRGECNWNIHHKDGNHLNNDIDNLIQLTSKEHAKIHASWYETGYYEKLLEFNKQGHDLYKNRKKILEQTKQFLEEYTNKRLSELKKQKEVERKQQREQKREQIQKQKEVDIQDKLSKGWKLNSKGIAYDPEVKRTMVLYRSKESYKQMGKKIKQLFNDNPEYRKNVCKNKGKISITNGIKIKYIDKEDLDKYISEGWVKGRKK